ncbi:hypothetical protein TRVL_08557 [Trypanosoma vivax]|uniref:Pyrroline-5-carboxylate reductase catalytic N-terminal domain-containing protein n=1 Tax=Trypanosoma vivax (strain Y486) TaxID=1055687 RepID=G0TYH6_TRYVY|nr:hypothetical protein TRVL_08557 [Trypanosoma vivax]CCC49023.1 conserved hypothetical protein [Trypanosoma vivax Y486]
MQEVTQHLLDSVLSLSCVDPSLTPSITGAPFVVATIAQQCFYACQMVSTSHATLSDGGSGFWSVMRTVAEVRERFARSRVVPPKKQCESLSCTVASIGASDDCSSSMASIDDGFCNANETLSMRTPLPVLSTSRQLSPLAFRVVVVGGGRVGRAIVERLLEAPHLIHPSRITIITRQTESVAQFAGRGVQCTGKESGRSALLQCHVLIIACQQAQFYDFAKIYCPRQFSSEMVGGGAGAVDGGSGGEGKVDGCGKVSSKLPGTRRRYKRSVKKKRTLQDVVNKWRTLVENGSGQKGVADSATLPSGRVDAASPVATEVTGLLSRHTLVFSCCAALSALKIAKELGHLEPLVVLADVDIGAVHRASQKLEAARDSYRSELLRKVALDGNSFLSSITAIQESYTVSSATTFTLPRLRNGTGNLDTTLALSTGLENFHNGTGCSSDCFPVRDKEEEFTKLFLGTILNRSQSVLAGHGRPPSTHDALHSEGVGGSAVFLACMWRALRCLTVVFATSLTHVEQRFFVRLHRIGPMLGAVLAALPHESQQSIVQAIKVSLNDAATISLSIDEDETNGQVREEVSIAANRCVAVTNSLLMGQRGAPAFDSDDDIECTDLDNVSAFPVQREMRRLVSCFPAHITCEEEALQLLRQEFSTVTERHGP